MRLNHKFLLQSVLFKDYKLMILMVLVLNAKEKEKLCHQFMEFETDQQFRFKFRIVNSLFFYEIVIAQPYEGIKSGYFFIKPA